MGNPGNQRRNYISYIGECRYTLRLHVLRPKLAPLHPKIRMLGPKFEPYSSQPPRLACCRILCTCFKGFRVYDGVHTGVLSARHYPKKAEQQHNTTNIESEFFYFFHTLEVGVGVDYNRNKAGPSEDVIANHSGPCITAYQLHGQGVNRITKQDSRIEAGSPGTQYRGLNN